MTERKQSSKKNPGSATIKVAALHLIRLFWNLEGNLKYQNIPIYHTYTILSHIRTAQQVTRVLRNRFRSFATMKGSKRPAKPPKLARVFEFQI